jgi:thiol-disulfide isomerase/thioredoxin
MARARRRAVAVMAVVALVALCAAPARAQGDDAVQRLGREVAAARDAAWRARLADTADGDAALRHPVRVAAWLSRWTRTADGPLRQALAAAVLLHADTAQLDSATAERVGASLDATSPAWAQSWAPYADALGAALRLSTARAYAAERASVNAPYRARWLAALDQVIARADAHPAVRRSALVRAARVRARREGAAAARATLEQLAREFPSDPDAVLTLAAYGPGGGARVGRLAPPFTLRTLDGRGTITRDALAGRVVLLDFWATWCAPCRAELPVIARALARHRTQGFDVVSVSFDRHPGLVERFMRTTPMPWRHAWATLLDDAAVAFAITQVPRAVLLGRDGTVLAMDEELRGDALEATLARVLAAR